MLYMSIIKKPIRYKNTKESQKSKESNFNYIYIILLLIIVGIIGIKLTKIDKT